MQPRQLVQAWVDAFNHADVDALADLYAEEAINHQVPESPVHGRDAIRQMFTSEFASATMVCIVESIFEEGESNLAKVSVTSMAGSAELIQRRARRAAHTWR
jgi:uncharacterized protein (TIGR02246 family)